MFVRETIEIKANLPSVFYAFWNILLWKKILKDVCDVQILYEDPRHQEFSMTVERQNGNETVKAIRFGTGLEQIEMFQTVPPPGFKYMQGVWSFREEGDYVCVEACRYFEPQNISDRDVENKLKGFLIHNLQSFKKYLENA